MKTDIYGLLGMIKDGNIPQKIIFGDYLYTYNKSRNDYETYIDKFEREYLFDEYIVFDILNEEVIILETTITLDGKTINLEELKQAFNNCPAGEKGESIFDEIERLEYKNIYDCDDYQNIFINFRNTWFKINEIIDKVNGDD